MKVSLRKFLEITGTDIIETHLCAVYVDTYDELFEEYFPKRMLFGNHDVITDVKELEPYMDYEIRSFDQLMMWGELDEQRIYLRKMECE